MDRSALPRGDREQHTFERRHRHRLHPLRRGLPSSSWGAPFSTEPSTSRPRSLPERRHPRSASSLRPPRPRRAATARPSVRREVEDLDALISEAGGSGFVFGMSSGARSRSSAARGLAITKLALYEPPFALDENSHKAPDDFPERLIELVADGRPGDAVEYFLTAGLGMPREMVARCAARPCGPDSRRWRTRRLRHDPHGRPGRANHAARTDDHRAGAAPRRRASPPWAAAAVDGLAELLPHAEAARSPDRRTTWPPMRWRRPSRTSSPRRSACSGSAAAYRVLLAAVIYGRVRLPFLTAGAAPGGPTAPPAATPPCSSPS